ncbi:unnamed protein product, partial [Polarella glacialis]
DDKPRLKLLLDEALAAFKKSVAKQAHLAGEAAAVRPPARSLHVHIRDSTNLKVAVEILHVICADEHDQPKHLLGIRDEDSLSRPLPPMNPMIHQLRHRHTWSPQSLP